MVSHADVDHYNASSRNCSSVFASTGCSSALRCATIRPWPCIHSSTRPRDRASKSNRPGPDKHSPGAGRAGCECFIRRPQASGATDNAESLVLLVEYRGHKILLPGDLESPGLEMLESQPPVDCDVLLAPHHGSMRSDPPGFVAWSRPEWVVLSGSHQALDRPAIEAYRREGAQVLHTATSGGVVVTVDQRGLHVADWHDPPLDVDITRN